MSSSFSGKFVPNTYVNLLQTGQNNQVQGQISFTDPNGDTHTVVDAFGRKVQGVVIDQGNNADGGLLFKQSTTNLRGLNVKSEMDITNQGLRFLKYTSTENTNLFLDEKGLVVGQDYDPTGTFPNFSNTYESNIKLYTKRGVYLRFSNQVGNLKSDQHLVISAENDTQINDTVNVINLRDENVISSGVQIYENNAFEKYFVCIWSRSGNVITCDVWINHEKTIGGNQILPLPVYLTSQITDNQFGSFGFIGHGVNFSGGQGNNGQILSQAVEFKSRANNREFEVTNTGHTNSGAPNFNNVIFHGITRGRFSYKLN